MALSGLVDDEQLGVLQMTVTAIGGVEEDENGNVQYVKGDECTECLGDLIRAIKRDDEATNGVTHQLGIWQVLQEHLLPILHTYKDDEMLIRAAIRLAVYLTKPNPTWKDDPARHLEYMQAHKLALLEGPTLDLLVGMLVTAMAIPPADRPPAALEIMANILQLFRNLVHVPDMPIANTKKIDGSRVGLSGLQDILVQRFKDHGVLDVLFTLASAIDDEKASKLQIDYLVLEVIYLLYLRTTPDSLADATTDPGQLVEKTKEQLRQAIEHQQLRVRDQPHNKLHLTARHSRFGGSFKRQSETGETAVLTKSVTVIRDGNHDAGKKLRAKIVLKKNAMETMFVEETQLSERSLVILQQAADDFLTSGYHTLMTLLVKRFTGTVGVYDKDITLYMWVASYFLCYFNLRRSKAAAAANDPADAASAGNAAAASSSFGFVGTSLELDTIRFIVNKVRVDYLAPESRNWSNVHVGVKCLRETLLVVESMARDETEATRDVADHLMHNLFYENQLLELTLELWREYTQQPRAYAVSLVELTDVLIRLLESYSKQKPLYVLSRRRRSRKRKSDTALTDANNEDDAEEDEEMLADKRFEFENYVLRFASDHIVTSYVELLDHFESHPASVNRMLVRLLHRFFVAYKVQGLFYKLRNLDVFNRILQRTTTPSTDRSHADVRQFVLYVIKCFFKRMQEYPILHLEALFPKTIKDSMFVQMGENAPKRPKISASDASDAAKEGSPATGDSQSPKLVQNKRAVQAMERGRLQPGAFDGLSSSDEDDEDDGRPLADDERQAKEEDGTGRASPLVKSVFDEDGRKHDVPDEDSADYSGALVAPELAAASPLMAIDAGAD